MTKIYCSLPLTPTCSTPIRSFRLINYARQKFLEIFQFLYDCICLTVFGRLTPKFFFFSKKIIFQDICPQKPKYKLEKKSFVDFQVLLDTWYKTRKLDKGKSYLETLICREIISRSWSYSKEISLRSTGSIFHHTLNKLF